jgi:Short C-terminal domain
MSQQQPIRVVVEHKKSSSGCGAALLVLIAIGLAIKYWYVSVAIVVMVVVMGVVANERQKQKAREQARHRRGPRDPWLNELAVALADFGLTETARNTGHQLGGVPLEGDIALQGERFTVYVNLFADGELARQAELGLRANPSTRDSVTAGRSEIKTTGRVLYVADGQGHALDELRFDEVMRTVGKIALPAPLPAPVAQTRTARKSSTPTPASALQPSPDALEQLHKLGELREANVLTQSEFEAKKAELLRRV